MRHPEHDLLLAQVGRRVRAERIRLKLTLPTLARLAGVSKSVISRVENGRSSVEVLTLYRLAWVMQAQPRRFLPNYFPGATPSRVVPMKQLPH